MNIKVGIIGSGFIGPAHIEAIRRLGFVEVIALAEKSLPLAKQKAAELSVPLAYGSSEELLANSEIQVVHNCTPNHIHAEINKKIILAGKHVFSEKPLCLNSQEAKELIILAQQYNVVHGISFVYRHFAMVQQAASMIHNNTLGRIFAVHGTYLQDWLMFDSDYNWRIEPEIGGPSRVISDIGSHWCDTIQFVTGKKIQSVFADLKVIHPLRKANLVNNSTFSQRNDSDYELKQVKTEDYATVLLRFDDGSIGSFTVSQISAGRKNYLTFEIDGENQSVAWNQERPQELWLGYRDKPNQILFDDPILVNSCVRSSVHFPGGHIEGWADAFKNMMSKYYEFIRDNKKLGQHKPDFATFNEGTNIMLIIDAIMLSYKYERWVDVSFI